LEKSAIHHPWRHTDLDTVVTAKKARCALVAVRTWWYYNRRRAGKEKKRKNGTTRGKIPVKVEFPM
jgi:hypothetical protein